MLAYINTVSLICEIHIRDMYRTHSPLAASRLASSAATVSSSVYVRSLSAFLTSAASTYLAAQRFEIKHQGLPSFRRAGRACSIRVVCMSVRACMRLGAVGMHVHAFCMYAQPPMRSCIT